MKILSIGDNIATGAYIFHSGFRKVKNYSADGRLLCIADSTIDNGPVNIIVDDISCFSTEKIIVEKDRIIFGYCIEKTAGIKKYNSTIDPEIISRLIISEIENELKPILIENSHSQSLAFIFDKSRMDNFKTGFERAFTESIFMAVKKINDGEIIEGVKSIKGRGFGLTPAGDDFMAGMLNALYIIQIISRKNKISDLRNEIKNTAFTKNLISSNAIYFSADGRFNEAFRNMVVSLARKDKELIQQNTLRILKTGETSGADLLTGFLFTFAAEIKFKRFTNY